MTTLEQYTQNALEREGVYRAFPVAWTVVDMGSKPVADGKEASKAVSINFRFAIHQEWSAEHKMWSQQWPVGYFAEGAAWIVGKEGKINDTATANLAKCGLWNGDWDALNGPPPNVFVLIDVQSDNYGGKLRYRAAWINPNADEPQTRGGFTPATPALIASLRSRFGSSTRAIAGGGPTGAPPAPPPMTPAAHPMAAPVGPPMAGPPQLAPGVTGAPPMRQPPAAPRPPQPQPAIVQPALQVPPSADEPPGIDSESVPF